MRALVLAAGSGKRLLPLTSGTPKPLLRVGGRALIDHALHHCVRNGIREILVVSGHHRDILTDHLAKRQAAVTVNVVHNPKFDEVNNIYSVHLARRKLRGKAFVLINGDVLFSRAILADLLHSPGAIVLAVDTRSKLKHEEMKVVTDELGRIRGIGKALDASEGNGEYIGLSKFEPDGSRHFFDAVEGVMQSSGPDQYYETAFQHLVGGGMEIRLSDVKGEPWIEIDFLEDLQAARKLVQEQGIYGAPLSS